MSFWSVFIVSGTNERDMTELRVAQIIAISFGALWAFSLGLKTTSMARKLKRTLGATRQQAFKLGVSLGASRS